MKDITRDDEQGDSEDFDSSQLHTINILQIHPELAQSLTQLDKLNPGFAKEFLNEYILDMKHLRKMESDKSERQQQIIDIIKNQQKEPLIPIWGRFVIALIAVLGTIFLGSIGKTNVSITLIISIAVVILAIKGISAFTPK